METRDGNLNVLLGVVGGKIDFGGTFPERDRALPDERRRTQARADLVGFDYMFSCTRVMLTTKGWAKNPPSSSPTSI